MMIFDQSPLISEYKLLSPFHEIFKQTSYKELYLTNLPPKSNKILQLIVPTVDSQFPSSNSKTFPPNSYSQSFSYNNTLYLFTVFESTIIIYSQYLIYNPKRVPLPKDSYTITPPQSNINKKFFNNRLNLNIRFKYNISANLCFGSLDYKPYVIIPLINGCFYIIELSLEDYVVDASGDKLKGASFQLNTNGNFLLGIQNISNLFKDQEKAWNLVMICSLSNGTLGLYEASIQSAFKSFSGENMNTFQINPYSEINLFYSGLFGKIKNYSDYYLKNENDSILSIFYFSNYLCFVLTKEMVLKLVNILNKSIIMEVVLEDFKINKKNVSFSPYFKMVAHEKNPFIGSHEGTLNMLLLIGELKNADRSWVKMLNIAIGLKKGALKNKGMIESEFELNLISSEDICSSAEITINENLHVSSHPGLEILDFSLNNEGIFIATFDELNNRNQVKSFEFSEKKNFQSRGIFNFDEKIDYFLQEDQKSKNILDSENLVDRLFIDQRYPTSELMNRFIKEGENTLNNNIFTRGKIKEKLYEKKEKFRDIDTITQDFNDDFKQNNKILCFCLERNQGIPIIWREKAIAAMVKIDFIEEFNENAEMLKNVYNGNNLHLYLIRIREKAKDLYGNSEIMSKYFQINMLIKASLQINQEKLVKSLMENNRNQQNFLNFLSECVKSQIHYIDSQMYQKIKISYKNLISLPEFDNRRFFHQIMQKFLVSKFENNRNTPDLKNIAEFSLPLYYEEWSSLIYSLCAGKLKTSIRNYAGFCLDLLIFNVFLESFGFEFAFEMKKNEDFQHFLNIEKLARLTEMLIAFNYSLNQEFNGVKETGTVQVIGDLLEGDQFIDVSRVFLVENHMNLLESSKNFIYSKVFS